MPSFQNQPLNCMCNINHASLSSCILVYSHMQSSARAKIGINEIRWVWASSSSSQPQGFWPNDFCRPPPREARVNYLTPLRRSTGSHRCLVLGPFPSQEGRGKEIDRLLAAAGTHVPTLTARAAARRRPCGAQQGTERLRNERPGKRKAMPTCCLGQISILCQSISPLPRQPP